jgi:predicted deacylase
VEPEDVQALVTGTMNVMRHLKMLPGAATRVESPVWIDHLADVASDAAGIFYPLVRRGAYVEAGMKIGYITDFVGRVVSEPRAKAAGVLLYVRAVPSISKGDAVASVGVVGKAPQP